MIYAVSAEGVAALRTLANEVLAASEGIIRASSGLMSAAEAYERTLGPHAASLYGAMRDILAALKASEEPRELLSQNLNDVADAYQEIIEMDMMRSPAAGTAGTAASALAGGQSAPQSSPRGPLTPADIGRFKNGTPVVKGDHFEQFMDDYYNSDGKGAEPVQGDPIRTVSPASIEGIHLGEDEARDISVFWGMHGYSKELYRQTASLIPEVKAALASGRSLEELEEDPRLGTCAANYFDPDKMPTVEDHGEYYTFSGNGRHRILTARELGYDIPVRVVGVRHRQ